MSDFDALDFLTDLASAHKDLIHLDVKHAEIATGLLLATVELKTLREWFSKLKVIAP